MVDKLRKVHFKYLDYLFEDMYPVKSKFYPNSTFFKKKDKVTLELEKSGTLWVLYSVWTSISDMFSLNYNETQQLIKAWMEQQLKSEEVTPTMMIRKISAVIEQQLKSEEVTPKQAVFPIEYPEEITPEESIPTQIWLDLEKKEITPRSAIAPPFRWRKLDSVKYAEIKPTISTSYRLEEKIKSEEITPRQVVPGSFDWVQEQIIPEKTTCFIDSVRWKKMND